MDGEVMTTARFFTYTAAPLALVAIFAALQNPALFLWYAALIWFAFGCGGIAAGYLMRDQRDRAREELARREREFGDAQHSEAIWRDQNERMRHALRERETRDPLLCPGDGCRGCFHCTSTEGETDADEQAEPGWDMERTDRRGLPALAGVEGEVGEPPATEGLSSPAELPRMVGRARPRVDDAPAGLTARMVDVARAADRLRPDLRIVAPERGGEWPRIARVLGIEGGEEA
jgi:hypothetical protein